MYKHTINSHRSQRGCGTTMKTQPLVPFYVTRIRLIQGVRTRLYQLAKGNNQYMYCNRELWVGHRPPYSYNAHSLCIYSLFVVIHSGIRSCICSSFLIHYFVYFTESSTVQVILGYVCSIHKGGSTGCDGISPLVAGTA